MESDGAHDRDANPADPRLSDPDAGSASGLKRKGDFNYDKMGM